MRVITMLLILFSCQQVAARDRFGVFQKHVDTFIVAAKQQHISINLSELNIALADKLPLRYVGICFGMGTQYPMIFIDKSNWDKASLLYREEIVWHEMGHCILGREHTELTKFDGHPTSIMYPDASVVRDENYYLKHKQDYIEELFHPDYFYKRCN